MRNHKLFSALAAALLLASCGGQKENNNDETSIHARADSIVGTRMQEINQRAMDDLEKRMTIEVKAKADSIVAVRMGNAPAAPKPVTTKDSSFGHRRSMLVPDAKMLHSNDSARR